MVRLNSCGSGHGGGKGTCAQSDYKKWRGGDDLPSEKTISSLRRTLLYEVSTLETRLGYNHDEGLTGENHVTIHFKFFFGSCVSSILLLFVYSATLAET